MPSNLALPDSTTDLKSFWSRPEGKAAMLIYAGIIGVCIFFWGEIVPWILNMLIDTLHMAYLVGVLAAILYLVFGKRPQLMFRVLVRKLTSIFVAVYPIEIIEDKLLQMKKKKATFDDLVGLVNGAIERLQRVIQRNQNDYNVGMRNAATAHQMAQSQQNSEEAQKLELQKQLQARKAQRRQNANIGYTNLLDRLQKMYKFLTRYSNNINFLIEDTTDDIEQKKTEYETTETAFGAFKKAMSILKGSPVEEDMYNQAFVQIENTISSQLGMMDHMQELSESFMRGVDIENGAVDQQALDALNAFEQKLLMAGSDPVLKMVTTDMSSKKLVPVPASVGGTTTSDYDDLLK